MRKNLHKNTLKLSDIKKKSDFKKDKNFFKIVKEVCAEMRRMMRKGHDVKLPFFGTLHITEKKSRVYSYLKENGKRCTFDKRYMDYGLCRREPETNAKSNTSVVRFQLVHRINETHFKNIGFRPNKLFFADMMNNILGYDIPFRNDVG